MNDKKLRIFLADDDVDDRLLFCDAIEELGIETLVNTFENGVDLMAHLIDEDKGLPDMIFLDLNMPLMNGEECLDDIRSEPALSKIPIIIYSTSLDHKMAEVLQDKGANLYLQKPKSYSQLKESLSRSIDAMYQYLNGLPTVNDFIVKTT